MPARSGARRILKDKQTFQIPANWTLTFEDNFPGSSLDSSKWNTAYWFGNTNTGNNELEWYLPGNVTIADGRCSLTAKEETGVHNSITYNYTSGILSSHDKFYQTYGYFEASVKVPRGQGLWPAFWMLPQDHSWPPEIDIMEILGHQTYKTYSTLHYDSGGAQQSSSSYSGGPDYSLGFHTFAVHWTASFIRWYVDGYLRYEVTANIPNKDMYLLLNLAVGGDWPGSPDGTTVFPSSYEIEYVRAYQDPNAGSSLTGYPIGLALSLTYA